MAIGVCGCVAALAAGAAAASDHGVVIAGAMAGLALCGIGTVLYVRDPVLAFISLWLFEVFNPALAAAVGYSSSAGGAVREADELLVLLFVGLTIWLTVRRNTRMPPLRFILPGVGVAVCGLLAASLHGVPVLVAGLGAWLGLKLWVLVVVTLLLPWRSRDTMRVYTVATRVGLLVAVLGIADFLTHGAVSRALHTSAYRFEAEAFRGEAAHSIFPVPGEYSLFMSLLFALTFARFATNRSKADLGLALLFAVSIVLSLRLKGFLSLAAVVAIVGLAQGAGHNRRGVVILLVGVLVCVGAYSIEATVIAKQVSKYTATGTSARARLYATGEQIARDDFPLGVGFGRFGSYPSRLYYSPVYYEYELSNVYGLSRAYPNFIEDTSWPSVIGETGYAGAAIYLVGMLVILAAIIGRLRAAPEVVKWVPLAALCMMAVLLVTSLGQGTLFDWLATTSCALVLGPALALAA